MSTILDPIRLEVQNMKGVVDSTLLLIQRLADAILNAPTLEEAQAIATEVNAEAKRLADAVAANP